jgi:signal transduction histidine kinase
MIDGGERPLPLAERLVAVYAAEEGLSNALRHGHATDINVLVDTRRPTDQPHIWFDVTIDDNGCGFKDPTFSGLLRHRERIESRGGTINLGPSPLGGARLKFSLPYTPQLADKPSPAGQ